MFGQHKGEELSLRRTVNELAGKLDELREQFYHGSPAREVDRLRSCVVDGFVRSLFSGVVPAGNRRICLVATGGYGRGELSPFSDIDLMFLHTADLEEDFALIARSIASPFWDLKIDVSYSMKTIDESIKLAEIDLVTWTSLMESRYLAGSEDMYREFKQELEKSSKKWGTEKYIEFLLKSSAERHKRYGDASYMLEPHIKEGAGGLRDYHAILWAARVVVGEAGISRMAEEGMLDDEEAVSLQNSVEFVSKIREHLHYRSGRKSDRLYFGVQEELAAEMGFESRNSVSPIIEFMRCYYFAARNIKEVNQSFFKRITDRSRTYPVQSIGKGLAAGGGWILTDDRGTAPRGIEWVMNAVREAGRRGLEIHPDLKRTMARIIASADEDEFKASTIHETFLSFAKDAENFHRYIEIMNQTGLLRRYMPEFEKIAGLKDYSTYHVYTLDIHTFLTLRELSRLIKGEYESEFPLITRAIREVERIDLLVLGALLHDIGKVGPGEHPQRGAAIAADILHRIGLDAESADIVVSLVRNHTLLVRTAQRRNLNDEDVILRCADEIGSVQNLNMLYCLTFADSRATGPTAWSKWKEMLVHELYEKTKHILERGSGVSKQLIRAEDIMSFVSSRPGVRRRDVEEFVKKMPNRYLGSVRPSEAARHFLLVSRATGRLFSSQASYIAENNMCEWTVCTRDRPGLFSCLAGVLTINGLNILSANIYTGSDGLVLDIFQVTHPRRELLKSDRLWRKVDKDLADILEGKLDLDRAVKHYVRPSPLPSVRKPTVATRITVDNQSSDFFTIVEICSFDRPGVLFKITRSLYRLGLNVFFAKITTKNEEIIDTFYIRDLSEQKVLSPEQLEEIQKSVISELQGHDQKAS